MTYNTRSTMRTLCIKRAIADWGLISRLLPIGRYDRLDLQMNSVTRFPPFHLPKLIAVLKYSGAINRLWFLLKVSVSATKQGSSGKDGSGHESARPRGMNTGPCDARPRKAVAGWVFGEQLRGNFALLCSNFHWCCMLHTVNQNFFSSPNVIL